MTDLTGKTVLVTAAAQGIGRASAIAFARAGAKVHATDVNLEKLNEIGSEPNIGTDKLDVLSDDAVKTFIDSIGKVDVLANCAGFVHAGSILEMKDEDFEFAMNLNVRSMIRTIRAVLPGMLERGDGAIVNIASVAGSVKGGAEPLRLWRLEGCRRRADQGGGGRLCSKGHPLQLYMSRHCREPFA
jgi:2-keto-3-deoxy-L-fuconate dehydrogenase